MTLLRLALAFARLAAQQALRHASLTVGLWACAVLALLVGATGFVVALWIALAQALGPVMAALAIGCGSTALGIALLLIVRMRRAAPLLPPAAMAELRAAMADKKIVADLLAPIFGVAVLGLLFGHKPKDDPPAPPEA